MTIDSWINTGILLVGVLTFLLPLHLDNRRKAQQQAVKIEKIWKKLKSHDKKTKQTRTIAQNVVSRLTQLEQRVNQQ